MSWYRNAGRGDNPGRKVNLNPNRPRFHKAREDWIRSGLAVCGADIRRAGFVQVRGIPSHACQRCLRTEHLEVRS